MSNKKVPDAIGKEIKELVFKEADRINYLARTRTDNNAFLARLVAMPDVGVRLSQFIKKADLRTYIKDAILNRYSKDKAQEERPEELRAIIKKRLGIDAQFIERDARSQTSLFKPGSKQSFIVVTDGTVLKWETALRKALLYIAARPFSDKEGVNVAIILNLFARHQKVPPSSVRHLEKALSLCNACLHIYGED
jgi:hypothetical protein